MSEFSVPVGVGSGADTDPRVLTAQYGGGYKQALPDGPNNCLRKWNLTFNNRDWATLSAVNAFLKSKKGATAFTWTPVDPVGTDEGEISVRCQHWGFKWDAGGTAIGMTMVFEEVGAI